MQFSICFLQRVNYRIHDDGNLSKRLSILDKNKLNGPEKTVQALEPDHAANSCGSLSLRIISHESSFVNFFPGKWKRQFDLWKIS